VANEGKINDPKQDNRDLPFQGYKEWPGTRWGILAMRREIKNINGTMHRSVKRGAGKAKEN